VAGFSANPRPLAPPPSGSFRFFAPQFARALEALLALVFAQNPSFVDTSLEAPQELIEWLAFANFNVHLRFFMPLAISWSFYLFIFFISLSLYLFIR